MFKKGGSLRKCRELKKRELSSELFPRIKHESIVSAKLICEASVTEGDELEVCVTGDHVEVFKLRNKIAFIPNMRLSLRNEIARSGGRVVGRVDHKMNLSKQLAIAIVSQEQQGGSDGSTTSKTLTSR